MRNDEPAGAVVLAATDPANPYGASLPWPKREGSGGSGVNGSGEGAGTRGTPHRRAARVAGAYVVTLDAEPALYVERGGKGLVPLRESARAGAAHPSRGSRRPSTPWPKPCAAGGSAVSASSASTVEPVVGSPAEALLVDAGFRQGPRKLTLSA
ncbi:MAG: hypothetical protein WKF31_04745 [Thermoleophilaceae bacterium]